MQQIGSYLRHSARCQDQFRPAPAGSQIPFQSARSNARDRVALRCLAHALFHTATIYHARQVARVERLQGVLHGQVGVTLQDSIHQMSVPAMMLTG